MPVILEERCSRSYLRRGTVLEDQVQGGRARAQLRMYSLWNMVRCPSGNSKQVSGPYGFGVSEGVRAGVVNMGVLSTWVF